MKLVKATTVWMIALVAGLAGISSAQRAEDFPSFIMNQVPEDLFDGGSCKGVQVQVTVHGGNRVDQRLAGIQTSSDKAAILKYEWRRDHRASDDADRGFASGEWVLVSAYWGRDLSDGRAKGEIQALDRAHAELRRMAIAIESYAIDHDNYPTLTDGTLWKTLVPTYIKLLPMDDPWGNPYEYHLAPTENAYALTSPGPDGEYQTLETQRLLLGEIGGDRQEFQGELPTDTDDLLYSNGRFLRTAGYQGGRLRDIQAHARKFLGCAPSNAEGRSAAAPSK